MFPLVSDRASQVSGGAPSTVKVYHFTFPALLMPNAAIWPHSAHDARLGRRDAFIRGLAYGNVQ